MVSHHASQAQVSCDDPKPLMPAHSHLDALWHQLGSWASLLDQSMHTYNDAVRATADDLVEI